VGKGNRLVIWSLRIRSVVGNCSHWGRCNNSNHKCSFSEQRRAKTIRRKLNRQTKMDYRRLTREGKILLRSKKRKKPAKTNANKKTGDSARFFIDKMLFVW